MPLISRFGIHSKVAQVLDLTPVIGDYLLCVVYNTTLNYGFGATYTFPVAPRTVLS